MTLSKSDKVRLPDDFAYDITEGNAMSKLQRINKVGRLGLIGMGVGLVLSLFFWYKLKLPAWGFFGLLVVLVGPGTWLFVRSLGLVNGVPPLADPHADNEAKASVKPKRDKPPTPKREPKFKPTMPVPTQGLRGLFWKYIGQYLYASFGWKGLTIRSSRERYHGSLARLWELRYFQKIIAVLNKKGGSGKTMLSVWLSKMLAFALKAEVLAIDANENGGDTAKGLGILREKTLGLRTFLANPSKFSTLAKLRRSSETEPGGAAWEPETGVLVIAAEVKREDIEQKPYVKGLRVLKRCVHTIVCDCGNGTQKGSNLGSVDQADTLVFVARKGSGRSLDGMLGTMQLYRDMSYEAKVTNSILVIVGGIFSWRNRKKFAKLYDWPVEQVFVIPWNRYMKSDEPARLSRIPLRVKAALAEIAVAILEAQSVDHKVVDNGTQKVADLQQNSESDRQQATDQSPQANDESLTQPIERVDSNAEAAQAPASDPAHTVDLSKPAPAASDNTPAGPTQDASSDPGTGQTNTGDLAERIRQAAQGSALVSAGISRSE